MRKFVLIITLVLLTGAFAMANGIPNLTAPEEKQAVESKIPMEITEDPTNGRPQKMDSIGDRDPDKLNPVERTIIIRDSIINSSGGGKP